MLRCFHPWKLKCFARVSKCYWSDWTVTHAQLQRLEAIVGEPCDWNSGAVQAQRGGRASLTRFCEAVSHFSELEDGNLCVYQSEKAYKEECKGNKGVFIIILDFWKLNLCEIESENNYLFLWLTWFPLLKSILLNKSTAVHRAVLSPFLLIWASENGKRHCCWLNEVDLLKQRQMQISLSNQ